MATVPYAHITQGPAIVRPLATPVVVPQRRGINPLIPLCLLGLILFLIAATIILALIPVYLKSRGERSQLQAVPFTALYRLNNGYLLVGPLSDGNCAIIRDDQRNLASSNNVFPSSALTVVDCTTLRNETVPSRRRRQSTGPVGNLIQIVGFIFGEGSCRRGNCLVRRAERFRDLLLSRGTFFLTLTSPNGSPFRYSITCISVLLGPPQDVSTISNGGGSGGGTGGGTGGGSSTSNAARLNDIAILNYALVLERLEANFYSTFRNNFTRANFVAAGFDNETYDYFELIGDHELAHQAAFISIISQLGGTPVPACTYNFSVVTDVPSYVAIARLLENTGAMAYTGAAHGIADPILREIAATVATVEARHAAYLNILNKTSPFPTAFQEGATPSAIVTAITPFLTCSFEITLPTIPYIGSTSYSGTIPTSNNTATFPYTQAMYTNDLRALNFALVSEQLEASFYERYNNSFTFENFTDNELSSNMIAQYFNLIGQYEAAHVSFLRQAISNRGGTPVSPCTYSFNVTDAASYVATSRLLENTGQKAYDGAIGTISDPVLIQGGATIALIEARFASFLNLISDQTPFPLAFDQALPPAEVVAILSNFQTCPFTPELPVVLTPSNLTLTL